MGRSPNANQGISHNVLKPSEGHRNCDDWAILKISLFPKKSLEVVSTNKKKGCWGILGDFQQLAPLKTTLKSNAHTPPDKCQLESSSYWSHTGWEGEGLVSLGVAIHGHPTWQVTGAGRPESIMGGQMLPIKQEQNPPLHGARKVQWEFEDLTPGFLEAK